MTLFKTLRRGAGLGLCVVAFSGTALADPGKGNGNQPATPPGQEKKAEQQEAKQETTVAPTPAAAPSEAKKAEKQAKKAERKAQNALKPERAESKQKLASKPAKAERKAEKAESKQKADSKPAKADTSTKGQSANAHHHVIICHRTGSLSNPYVVINIPYTAWMHAHSPSTGAHPPKNGHVDILLKDPASRPGSKDGFTKAACGGPATTVTPPATSSTPSKQPTGTCPATTATERVLVGVWHATGSYKNGERKYVFITPSLGSAHYTKHEDDKPVYEDRTATRQASGETCATATTSSSNTTGTANTQSSVQTSESAQSAQSSQPSQTKAGAQAPARGVAGAVSPAAEKSKPAGGVLGAVANSPKAVAATATTGTLPFTGIPLWIVALIGGALLAAGFMLRRTA